MKISSIRYPCNRQFSTFKQGEWHSRLWRLIFWIWIGVLGSSFHFYRLDHDCKVALMLRDMVQQVHWYWNLLISTQRLVCLDAAKFGFHGQNIQVRGDKCDHGYFFLAFLKCSILLENKNISNLTRTKSAKTWNTSTQCETHVYKWHSCKHISSNKMTSYLTYRLAHFTLSERLIMYWNYVKTQYSKDCIIAEVKILMPWDN